MDSKKISQNTRRRKILVWAGALLAFYTIFGFLILPAIIKSQMLKKLPGLTKRAVTIETVKVNPYALSLTIRGLKLTETNNETFAAIENFYANVELSSLVHWAIVFKEISITHHFAQVTLRPDGTFNFANFVADSPSPSGPRKSLPRVIIRKLNIDNGVISFSDLARKTPFHTKLATMNIHLTNFTTKPGTDNPYSFTAETDSGEMFSWSGDVSVEPVKSHGKFKLTGLEIKKYSPYLRDFARFNVLEGRLNVAAEYSVSIGPNGIEGTIAQANAQIANLQLNDGDEKVLFIPKLDVGDGEANLAKKTIQLGAVTMTGASVLVRQNQDGTINLLSALKPTEPALPATTNSVAAPSPNNLRPWAIKVGEVAIDNWEVNVEDKRFAKNGAATLGQFTLSIKDIVFPDGAPMPITFSTRVNESGTLDLSGSAGLFPPSAELKVKLASVDLRPFQPFVDGRLKMTITGGTANSEGTLLFSATNTNTAQLKLKGGFEINEFTATDQKDEFVKFNSFKISGADVELLPNKIIVDELQVTGLQTSVVVSTNRQINLLAILPPKPTGENNAAGADTNLPATTHPESAAPQVFPIDLNTFILENASIKYSDHSITPTCNFDIQEFGGTIKGLSSKNDKPADVDIRGKIDERSTFSIVGKLHPLATSLFVDLEIATKATSLTAFTPYMEKFGGYPLNKGNLSVTLHYDVQSGNLKAQNKIEIDQFTLGAKNNSPDATRLPVKLAVALLKDRKGKIELDVPLSGRLDDPKFKVGSLIWQVVMNILAKAATSPFALLGAMFGGGEEMTFVQFAPGSAEVPEAEAQKLDKLAKALYDRPALNLEILGSADKAKDKVALAHAKFEDQIKTLRVKELRDRNVTTNLADIKLEPEDRGRLVAALFKQISENNEGLAATAPVPGVNTNKPAASEISAGKPILLDQPVPAKPMHPQSSRGAEALFSRGIWVSKASPRQVVAAPPMHETKSIAETKPTVDSPRTLTVHEMEQAIVDRVEVSDGDLIELIQRRAQGVQSFLLKTEKVPADRLFILAPKPEGDATKGESRVNLSLK